MYMNFIYLKKTLMTLLQKGNRLIFHISMPNPHFKSSKQKPKWKKKTKKKTRNKVRRNKRISYKEQRSFIT